jgi:hypothetical protein
MRVRGVMTAYVRVDGRREIVLEPIADVELPAGRHRVEWRERPDEPWRSGGRFTLEAARGYTLRFSPSGVVLEPD